MTKKVLIIGDAGVGKSSLRTQYFHKTFSLSYRATIGANFLTKNIVLRPGPERKASDTATGDGRRPGTGQVAAATTTTTTTEDEVVALCIWDTAGQERFNSLSPTFFRGSDCAILLYDVTNAQSLSSLATHYREFLKYCGTRNPVILVVGNKSDAARQVTAEDARALVARELPGAHQNVSTEQNIDCFEVSAKMGTGVEDLFMSVARRLRTREERRELTAFDVGDEGAGTGFGVVDLKKRQHASGCAC
ncbi:protein of unknown function [Taphrina deformans PYCC 5710]|uniref:Uncharacterized protein n=1 Tax=Taphrina deformans (strain PYCC 5710 / ATCC 11124 / CBS 356.35 / IMI 108563 / JCM 9778 / NBRC 8474) TaxID=1097556 RepID=R4XF33_TAPDE|nr:protein of unknown function [Taphrina deformans PYCC 5710]|eukprot:CCG84253.1 protein of unknown function [Taphrina deformans PYCC 5710]